MAPPTRKCGVFTACAAAEAFESGAATGEIDGQGSAAVRFTRPHRRAILIAVALIPGSADAQVDPVGVGQGAMHSTTMRSHANRIAGRNAAERTSANARATCAKRQSIRARFGEKDPRVRRLFELCRRLSY